MFFNRENKIHIRTSWSKINLKYFIWTFCLIITTTTVSSSVVRDDKSLTIDIKSIKLIDHNNVLIVTGENFNKFNNLLFVPTFDERFCNLALNTLKIIYKNDTVIKLSLIDIDFGDNQFGYLCYEDNSNDRRLRHIGNGSKFEM